MNWTTNSADDDSTNLDEWRLEVIYISQWALGGLHHPWIGKIDNIADLSKPLDQNPWNMRHSGTLGEYQVAVPYPWVLEHLGGWV